MHPSVEVHHELLDVGARLVSEYVEHPAGSVLRCFARAVRLARIAGAFPVMLPSTSEPLARSVLDAREVGGRVPTSPGRPAFVQ